MRLQRTNETRGEEETFLSFSRFFLFPSSTIPSFLPSLCRLSTNVSRKRFASYHGVPPRRWNTIIRVSWKDRSHPLLRLLGFGLLLLPTNFFSSFFLLLPAKNLVRKCSSVVVKSNPDLISVHSRSFDFLYNLF